MDDELIGRPLSKINSASFINIRLHNLWEDCHNHSRKGNYNQWHDDLDRVWMELGGDIKEDDEKIEVYDKLVLEYAEACGETPQTQKGFTVIKPEKKVSFAKQKIALQKRELFLRRLQNKQGKGTAYHDEEDELV